MDRRKFIRNTVGIGLAAIPAKELLSWTGLHLPSAAKAHQYAGLRVPVTVYNNWSAYDELSDNIPQTEELAMRELSELVRLKKCNVKVDYYVMDAFWFDRTGGYRSWHKQHWPNGPDAWLKACKDHDILPGMWFSTNLIATRSGRFLDVIPEWEDSLATDPNIMCLFAGGYLKHLAGSLQLWAERGVKVFKFDFAYFNAATAEAEKIYLSTEIEEKNKLAFMDMLRQFRANNPDVLLIGYNGFGGNLEDTVTPFRKTIDHRWLEVFDTLYCGDPRFSDVPAMNIWRSQDIYSDHMVRQFEFNGLPLQRIDNCAFMIGNTGTCYKRALNGWKGELILSLARGGWLNVYHGNLELLSNDDAQWFAKAQSLFNALQRYALVSTFGAIPGTAKPYGFKAEGINGTVCTFVNPSQSVEQLELPVSITDHGALIYCDGGYRPVLNGKTLTLGPEQLAVVG